jgi:hypothetical protein
VQATFRVVTTFTQPCAISILGGREAILAGAAAILVCAISISPITEALPARAGVIFTCAASTLLSEIET